MKIGYYPDHINPRDPAAPWNQGERRRPRPQLWDMEHGEVPWETCHQCGRPYDEDEGWAVEGAPGGFCSRACADRWREEEDE